VYDRAPISTIDSALTKFAKGTLFVTQLDARATESTLLQLFRPFGTVTEWKYFWNKDHTDASFGTPRGSALVTMATPAEAQRARLALNGKRVGSQCIVVRPSIRRVEVPQNAVVEPTPLSDTARRNHITMLRSKLNAMRGITPGDVVDSDTTAAATTTTTADVPSDASGEAQAATKRKLADGVNNSDDADNPKEKKARSTSTATTGDEGQ
jgi:RNA recognition motif-containing protein